MDTGNMFDFLVDIEAMDKSNEATAKKIKKKEKEIHETLEDAWTRIFNMNNKGKELEKLQIVHQAMLENRIGRDPSKKKPFSKTEALRMYKELQEREREDTLRKLVENTPDNYRLINTPEAFNQLLADLEYENIVALDTETTGLNVYKDTMVGISITLPNADYHVYIPFDHKEALGKTLEDFSFTTTTYQWDEKKEIYYRRLENQLDKSYVLDGLKPFIVNPSTKKVLHHAKFDAHMFIREGLYLHGIAWDTQTSMHLLNENEPSFRLKELAPVYLNEPADTFDELFGKDARFDYIPLDIALAYAGKDTDLTWKLYKFQLHHLSRFPDLLQYNYNVEIPLIPVLVDMEQEGFTVDFEEAKAVTKQLKADMDRLEVIMKQHFGDINVNSTKQLSEALYDDLRLGKHLHKNAKRKTDKETLKVLAPYNEGVKALLEYRVYSKLYGTYFNTLPEKVQSDGKLHGSFSPSGTVTGRFNSNDPNLQNLPKYARRMFVAPEGHVIIGMDFSQQEPRFLAHFTSEPALLEAYRNGQDLYAYSASELYNKPYEQCTGGAKERKNMKFGILSVMYGTGAKTLAGQLKISEEEAQQFIDDFYAKFKVVKRWIDSNKAYARKYGYIKMILGRKRRLPDAKKAQEYWKRAKAERQATNAIIQGSAAIQTKITILSLDRWCKQKQQAGRNIRLLCTVHDEILLVAPKDVNAQEIQEMRDIMINSVQLDVPNKTDIEIMERWMDNVIFDQEYNKFTCEVENSVTKEKKLTNLCDTFEKAYKTSREFLANNPEWKIAT